MTIKLMLLALLLVVRPASADAAPLAPPGVAACSNCHPKAGSETVLRPLNGRSAGDITAGMIAFRNGKRPATVMGRIAKGFSEAEINAMAAWYAAQR
jgi:sulfide dehydrogenase cytochrome subunit